LLGKITTTPKNTALNGIRRIANGPGGPDVTLNATDTLTQALPP